MKTSWIDDRLAGVPDELATLLRSTSDDLAAASLEALARAEDAAIGGPASGGDARGHTSRRAEPLLLADALITFACEQALEHADPEKHWAALLEQIGREPR